MDTYEDFKKQLEADDVKYAPIYESAHRSITITSAYRMEIRHGDQKTTRLYYDDEPNQFLTAKAKRIMDDYKPRIITSLMLNHKDLSAADQEKYAIGYVFYLLWCQLLDPELSVVDLNKNPLAE